MPHNSSKNTLLNLVAGYFGNFWIALMGFIFVPAYIKYLGLESFAIIGIFASIQAWLYLLDAGLSSTLNREMAHFTAGKYDAFHVKSIIKTFESIYLAIALFIVILVALAAHPLANHWIIIEKLPVETVVEALSLTGIIIGFRWMSTLYRSALLGLQHQVWLNRTLSIFATIKGVGAVAVLAYMSPTIQAFFIYQALITALETFVLAKHLKSFIPATSLIPQFSLRYIRNVWRFAAGMALIAVLSTTLTQIDRLILSGTVTLESFGIFLVALTLVGATDLLVSPLSTVYFPKFVVNLHENKNVEIKNDFIQATKYLSAVLIPIVTILLVFPQQVLYLWTQDHVLSNNAAPLVRLMGVAALFGGLAQPAFVLLQAQGCLRTIVLANTLGIVTCIPAMYFGVKNFGILSAPIVKIGLELFYCIYGYLIIFRQVRLEISLSVIHKNVILPLVVVFSVDIVISKVINMPLTNFFSTLLFIFLGLLNVTLVLLMNGTIRKTISLGINNTD